MIHVYLGYITIKLKCNDISVETDNDFDILTPLNAVIPPPSPQHGAIDPLLNPTTKFLFLQLFIMTLACKLWSVQG